MAPPADIAELLEALPQQQRLYVWESIDEDKAGDILLEISDAIRNSLLSNTHTDKLVTATETLDSDEIGISIINGLMLGAIMAVFFI